MDNKELREQIEYAIRREIDLLYGGSGLSNDKVVHYVLDDLPKNKAYIEYLIQQGAVGIDGEELDKVVDHWRDTYYSTNMTCGQAISAQAKSILKAK